jgi:hypothetical protein
MPFVLRLIGKCVQSKPTPLAIPQQSLVKTTVLKIQFAFSYLILLKVTISKDPTVVENEVALAFFLIHDKLFFIQLLDWTLELVFGPNGRSPFHVMSNLIVDSSSTV